MLIRVFKEQICIAAGDDPKRAFASLREFCADYGMGDDPHELAARALAHFCVDQGKFNRSITHLKACIAFLEIATENTHAERTTMLRDLARILNNDPQHADLLGWCVSNYPTRRQ
ncbi:MAG: hypothetical protein HY873_09630 [Chloroflexi bacterium]|nr:hypothetical protein [Chloroflexota bacterium]